MDQAGQGSYVICQMNDNVNTSIVSPFLTGKIASRFWYRWRRHITSQHIQLYGEAN